MGWSCSTPCKSRKAQAEMLAFLGEHFRPSHEVLPDWNHKHWKTEHPSLPSDFVQYATAQVYIGFDKPNDYEQAILRWVAFRIGKCRKFPKLLGTETTVPWVNHDRQRNGPVITRDQWDGSKRTEQYVVDDIGWQPVPRMWEGYLDWPSPKLLREVADRITGADKMDKAIRAEIERLDQLWQRSNP